MSAVTNMSTMFYQATSFNQDISSWDVSAVTNLRYMFFDATSFNQDISNWDVSKVTNMEGLFWGATSFNQNVGNWDVSKVTNMSSMFEDITISTANYDALLNGWSAQALQDDVNFNGGNSIYSSSSQGARNQLISNYNWIITDGGLDQSDF